MCLFSRCYVLVVSRSPKVRYVLTFCSVWVGCGVDCPETLFGREGEQLPLNSVHSCVFILQIIHIQQIYIYSK